MVDQSDSEQQSCENERVDEEKLSEGGHVAKKSKKNKKKKNKKKSKKSHKTRGAIEDAVSDQDSHGKNDNEARQSIKRKRDGKDSELSENEAAKGQSNEKKVTGADEEASGDARRDGKAKKLKKAKSKQQNNSDKSKQSDSGNDPSDSDENERDGSKNVGNVDDEAADSSADEDEDQELLAAAAAWADQRQKQQSEVSNSSSIPENGLIHSLHMTQLPYDANEWDIRQVLSENGCGDEYDEFGTSSSTISSIRLVYDKDSQGRKTLFRGVAFVDFTTLESYQTALSLHHKVKLRGRKLNLRPTKTKNELAQIVTQTQALVEEAKKQQQRKKHSDLHEDGVKSGPGSDDHEKRKGGAKGNNRDGKTRTVKKKTKDQPKHKVKSGDESKSSSSTKGAKTAKDPNRKLTKKERNRRAAIILSKQRGRSKR